MQNNEKLLFSATDLNLFNCLSQVSKHHFSNEHLNIIMLLYFIADVALVIRGKCCVSVALACT